MQTSFPVCHCWICPKYPNKVLQLNKALYGLKQAPRIWYLLLCGVIVGLGFQVLETDTSIYVCGQIITEVYIERYQNTRTKARIVLQSLSRAMQTFQDARQGSY